MAEGAEENGKQDLFFRALSTVKRSASMWTRTVTRCDERGPVALSSGFIFEQSFEFKGRSVYIPIPVRLDFWQNV